jgi:predicted homoserine dehydrogenase-like protein
MIGLETSISVLSAVLRNEPTGCSKEFRGDAVRRRSRSGRGRPGA